MESTFTELALYGSQNECAKIDDSFFLISEFCNGTVSLTKRGSLRMTKNEGQTKDKNPCV